MCSSKIGDCSSAFSSFPIAAFFFAALFSLCLFCYSSYTSAFTPLQHSLRFASSASLAFPASPLPSSLFSSLSRVSCSSASPHLSLIPGCSCHLPGSLPIAIFFIFFSSYSLPFFLNTVLSFSFFHLQTPSLICFCCSCLLASTSTAAVHFLSLSALLSHKVYFA